MTSATEWAIRAAAYSGLIMGLIYTTIFGTGWWTWGLLAVSFVGCIYSGFRAIQEMK